MKTRERKEIGGKKEYHRKEWRLEGRKEPGERKRIGKRD
jgi:hypothetical protein